MGEEVKETKEEAPSIKVDAVMQDRAKFLDDFDGRHEPAGEPVDLEEDNTDSKESDSEAPAVIEEQSDSSSVKEEKKGGSKTEDQAVDKTAEILQNKEKALHEEREKRKQANLKLRELQRQYDEKLAALEKKLESVNSKPVESEDASESDDPTVKNLQQRLKDLEAQKNADENKRRQEEVVAEHRKLQDTISSTDKQLKEAGFPGFRYAVNRVDEILKQMYAEGEIEREDYMNPDQWKSVYKDKVYAEISSEFKALQQKQALDDKKARKKEAAKVSAYPGSKPEEKSSEDEGEVETDDIRDYLKFRKTNGPKRA